MKNINILVEHLQRVTNKKVILVESDDFDIDTSGVFIPRRLGGRKSQLVKERLKELNITKTYSDGSIDVDGDVNLSDLSLEKLPIKFNKVTGNFWCYKNELISLEGCPKIVGGDFSCRDNKLTSLVGCPEKVYGFFYCYDNQLTSLKGCPEKVETFKCYNNRLTSLEGCPKEVDDDFVCTNNTTKFTKEQVRKICSVNGVIYV